jgi:GT2 family glycosyltransferase
MPEVTGPPDIAVVIPSYQRAQALALRLGELTEQTMAPSRFEVIVADDCSTDDTQQVVEDMARHLPYRVRVVRTPVNDGPAAARNLGWRATEAPVVAFLDDDCTPAPKWLEAGLASFDATPQPGVVQGATLLPVDADTTLLTDWWVCRHVVSPSPWFEGGNLFMTRVALEMTGGFDEDIHYYGEDCAAGWRILEAGYTRAFSDEAAVTHPMQHRGFRWYIGNGFLESRLVHCAAKHPGFRRAAFWRPWAYRREDPAFVIALAGIGLSVLSPFTLFAVVPYAWLRRPSIRRPSFFRLCLQVPLVDAARIAGHLRGSLRHRVFVL